MPARVVAVLEGADAGDAGRRRRGRVVEIFLDRTPFYAESGGQVGDTGTIVTESGIAEVDDTVLAVPGLVAHRARVTGEVRAGQDALATIDGERREAIRRNHTATHLLHAALRAVLGDHVRQQGSLVSPEYLRFDFSHHAAPTREELDEVFALANAAVLTGVGVETTETSRDEAEKHGGHRLLRRQVRLVGARRAGGTDSLEFCGGTHVDSLGQIGTITLLSEGSIGSNTRRIFAVTGFVSLDRALERERLVQSAAELLRTRARRAAGGHRPPDRAPARGREGAGPVAPAVERGRGHDAGRGGRGRRWGGGGPARQGGGRRPAQPGPGHPAPRRRAGRGARGLARRRQGGDRGRDRRRRPTPPSSCARSAKMVGGGGGGSAEVATAGGKDPSRIEAALAEAQRLLSA